MYVKEILQMMHGFGDARRPRQDSASLIEEIVRGQMHSLLRKALDVQVQRESSLIGVEELLFTLRKSPIRIQRLLKYLSVRDTVSSLTDESPGGEDSKRMKKCREFLEKLDTDGSLLDALDQRLVDDVRASRLSRLDFLSRDLDERKYAEFTRARQANFRGPKFPRQFHTWIARDLGGEEIRISKFALEVLSYLSYETVGTLVDMALVLRGERSHSTDPVARQMDPLSVNPQFPMVQIHKFSEEVLPPPLDIGLKADDSALCPWEIRQVVQRIQTRLQPLEWYTRGEKRGISSCPLFVV
eukprot:TRINITY_DN11240_c0_g1_i1.p1 TRINITY_DN11240_c0_g1~~TRINITY_DN11240_c0_g1_i1.p1  ORF type:complete len:299 (-),score=85.89 TRINITY_DN11240_c0_g1_i1:146-1042(-)